MVMRVGDSPGTAVAIRLEMVETWPEDSCPRTLITTDADGSCCSRENRRRSGSTRCTRAPDTALMALMERASSPSSARRALTFWTKLVAPMPSLESKIS